LQKVYHDKGYGTVAVDAPQPLPKSGVVTLQVIKNPVGRLRITGSRYYSLDEIRREAMSLQEGTVPNFNQVTKDLVVLNQSPDRRVTPSLQAGLMPGTVDVNLEVKDTPPLHGSLELNNRYSANTTPLRLNASVSYDNLWQLEHSIGFSFQVAPENPRDVKVFSGYYLARIPDVSWLSLMLQGTKQDSDVNTLGGIGVAGRGDTVGGRAIISLPSEKDFYQSISLGLDYKHFTQDILIAGTDSLTPVTYYPLSAAYSGTWQGKGYETDLNASVNVGLRGLGSDEAVFELNRHGASANFIYFRGDLSHTRDLPEGFQVFIKTQGQAADEPLVNSEQFSGGGLGTVRGLLESEVLGDNGLLGTIELRSPSLSSFLGKTVDEWRFYIFSDGGVLTQNDPLVETPYEYNLVSVGAGTRIKVFDHLSGSLDLGIPLVVDSIESSVPANAYVQNPIQERPYDARLTFRVWAEF
jgi:hemolysin activation/secretion protein